MSAYRDGKRRGRDVRPGGDRGRQHVDERAGRGDCDETQLLDPRRAHQDDAVPAADAVRLPARVDRQGVAEAGAEAARRRSHRTEPVERQQATTHGTQSNNGTTTTTTTIIRACDQSNLTERPHRSRTPTAQW